MGGKHRKRGGASAVVSLGWVEDDIGEIEVKAIEEISYIAHRNAEVASSVVSMGWVQDGINDVEAEAIEWVGNIGSVEVASAVVSLGWVEDGIGEIEVKAIEEILYIAHRSAEGRFVSRVDGLGAGWHKRCGGGRIRKPIRYGPILACVPTILTTIWDLGSLPPEVDSQSMLSRLQ